MQGRSRSFETVIVATMTTLFPGNLRFEKQSRWSMELVVTPTHPQDRLNTSTMGSDDGTVVQISLESPQKRKVSSSAVVDAATTSKRWRHDSMTEEPSDVRRSSNGLRESFLRDVLQYALHSPCTGPETLQTPQQPVEIQRDGGFPSLPRLPVISQPMTSDDIAISKRGSLEQEDIRQNYHEFADHRLFKDAGLVISPVSDGERRAYESIFMGDSDESSPVTEEGSMTWDAVMSDK